MSPLKYKRTVITVGSDQDLVNSDVINAKMDISRVQLNVDTGERIVLGRDLEDDPTDDSDRTDYFRFCITDQEGMRGQDCLLEYEELVALSSMISVFAEAHHNRLEALKDGGPPV